MKIVLATILAVVISIFGHAFVFVGIQNETEGLGVAIFGYCLLILSAGLVASVAQERNRRFWAWFVMSGFLPPIIMVFILLLLPARPNKVPAKRCPKCAELVRKEATVCKHCGHSFEEEQEDALAEVEPTDEGKDPKVI